MRLPRLPDPPASRGELPLWPPLLATRGPGGESKLHAHHALHLVLALDGGELRVRGDRGSAVQSCAGVLAPADVPHAIDARGSEVLLVFLDPESDVGRSLRAWAGDSLRPLTGAQRDALGAEADPRSIMQGEGAAWCRRAAEILGADARTLYARSAHPSVRRALRLLRERGGEDSLEALAGAVELSPSRFMHVFTESVGIPLRPYVAWLKLQRAAAAISAGKPLAEAAHAAGFADAAHMTRTFKRMLGAAPSELRPRASEVGSR